ncbi:MAG: glucose-1-phosphate adenylyltransferase [Ancalomicrobiaceae bacterium]|nr:glucose-1-phosphate adenylyltransferase [Ancalomicrobiaceae bacterium]
MNAIPFSAPRSLAHSALSSHAMAYVLAGGRGSRLMEMTDQRAKSVVPFGGKSRLIDFTLSNVMNSGIRRVGVAIQYKSHSLIQHLQNSREFFRSDRNGSFDILPARRCLSEEGAGTGTTDAVFQNLDVIRQYHPKHVVILASDHVYKMDYEQILQQHIEQGADVTVGCIEVDRDRAKSFGIMQVDKTNRILQFLEKPEDPPTLPGNSAKSLASMGIYVFDTKFLLDQLRRDSADPTSSRDFGKDLIPFVVNNGKAVAHHFSRSCVQSLDNAFNYWRDVGTIDAYWEANIDLTDVVPALDLYDRDWPIWTSGELTPPAKFVHDSDGRHGTAVSSLVSDGCIVSGSLLRRSLLFTGARINSFSYIENAVILPNATVGRSVRLTNVVVDVDTHIPDGWVVGDDPAVDAQRFRRTEKGICLITQQMVDALQHG